MSTIPWMDYSIFYAWRRMRAQSKAARASFIHEIHAAIPSAGMDEYQEATERVYLMQFEKTMDEIREDHGIDPADERTPLRDRFTVDELNQIVLAEDLCAEAIKAGAPASMQDVLQIITDTLTF